MKKLIVIVLSVVMIFGILTLSASAEPKKIDGDRLERGTKNVALGWTEIPNSVVKVTKDTNNPFLGITVGLVKGLLNTVARTTSGAVDMVSSPARPKQKAAAINPQMVEPSVEAATK